MRYAVVIEKAAKNDSAYVPDLPGCIAGGRRSKKRSTISDRPCSCTSVRCWKTKIRSRTLRRRL